MLVLWILYLNLGFKTKIDLNFIWKKTKGIRKKETEKGEALPAWAKTLSRPNFLHVPLQPSLAYTSALKLSLCGRWHMGSTCRHLHPKIARVWAAPVTTMWAHGWHISPGLALMRQHFLMSHWEPMTGGPVLSSLHHGERMDRVFVDGGQ
jgi:hypothetical protein